MESIEDILAAPGALSPGLGNFLRHIAPVGMEGKRKASNSDVVYSHEELLGENDLVPLAFDTRPDRRRRQIRQNKRSARNRDHASEGPTVIGHKMRSLEFVQAGDLAHFTTL